MTGTVNSVASGLWLGQAQTQRPDVPMVQPPKQAVTVTVVTRTPIPGPVFSSFAAAAPVGADGAAADGDRRGDGWVCGHGGPAPVTLRAGWLCRFDRCRAASPPSEFCPGARGSQAPSLSESADSAPPSWRPSRPCPTNPQPPISLCQQLIRRAEGWVATAEWGLRRAGGRRAGRAARAEEGAFSRGARFAHTHTQGV